MISTDQIKYNLLLEPLRFKPELAESVIFGLKWTLGSMFKDPFPVRDLVVAVREIVDNIVTHADWNQAPAPSLSVRYEDGNGVPKLRVSSTNVVKDPEAARCAVGFITENVSTQSTGVLCDRLTSHLIGSGEIRSSGGIGLLQVASSARCRLDVRLKGRLFCVQVEVDVPELASGTVRSRRIGS